MAFSCYSHVVLKSALVRARIDPVLKKKAEAILSRVGLDQSEAVRVYYRAVVNAGGVPFPLRIPNAETRKALADVKAGRVKTFSSTEALFRDLKGR